jgi:hypothetical protein
MPFGTTFPLGHKSFVASGSLALGQRVKLTTTQGVITVAGAADMDIGVVSDCADGLPSLDGSIVVVDLASALGTVAVAISGAATVGSTVLYTSSGGTVSYTGTNYWGLPHESGASTAVIEAQRLPGPVAG